MISKDVVPCSSLPSPDFQSSLNVVGLKEMMTQCQLVGIHRNRQLQGEAYLLTDVEAVDTVEELQAGASSVSNPYFLRPTRRGSSLMLLGQKLYLCPGVVGGGREF